MCSPHHMNCRFHLCFTQSSNSRSGSSSQECGWKCHGPFPVRNVMGCSPFVWQNQTRAVSTELSTIQCKYLSSMVTSQENEGQTTQIQFQFLLMENDHLNYLKMQYKSPHLVYCMELFVLWLGQEDTCTLLPGQKGH